ncbi:hypothetical protein SAMN05421835_12372 [Amycolatopsis sacchari]|uniref:Uncharacterized protein n=1 Tax=Amycolatopsis sacchari TaxID=115433 RepID=A0A1I4AAG3_9PSEU|nr:hypothetical protein [Amycolatopsis sacchari]SFK52759.1 hypothetical protein SAMN05421835_12372 [Amycolatopsis sacchari]
MPSKNTMVPLSAGRGGVLTKLIGTAVVVALLVIVVKHPADAAAWLKDLIGWGTGIVDGIASFIRQAAA